MKRGHYHFHYHFFAAMPAKRKPAYSLHRATGQARVRIDGRDHYLGPYGSAVSRDRYERLVTDWLVHQDAARTTLTIDELALLYLQHARAYYVKGDRCTSEVVTIRAALRPLVRRFGPSRAQEFGPARLKEVRQDMIGLGWARTTINGAVERIRRLFRWAVEEEHLPVAVHTALQAVAGLRRGRTAAREPLPVQPVTTATVDATLPFLPAVVADMVRFQRLTGCRPGEVCCLRPGDIDRSQPVWIYTPPLHKTAHHDRERKIFLGPQAQALLHPYLQRPPDACCFSPRESEGQRRLAATARRRTPEHVGNRPGSNRRPTPRRAPREAYDVASYRRAITRGCDQADAAARQANPDAVQGLRLVPRWRPNQLRHAAATEIRRRFGLEATQVVLGHSQADVTQVYAERDYGLAARVAAELG